MPCYLEGDRREGYVQGKATYYPTVGTWTKCVLSLTCRTQNTGMIAGLGKVC